MRRWLTSALLFAALGACARGVLYEQPNGDGSGTISSGDVAVDIVRYTNDVRTRAQGELAPLSSNARLMEAARIHARQMAAFNSMDHTISGAQYPTMVSRLEAVGYSYSNAAENIAWNVLTAQRAVEGWMNSPGHRANILNPQLTEMGAAVAQNSKGETYWIQVFGRPR